MTTERNFTPSTQNEITRLLESIKKKIGKEKRYISEFNEIIEQYEALIISLEDLENARTEETIKAERFYDLYKQQRRHFDRRGHGVP